MVTRTRTDALLLDAQPSLLHPVNSRREGGHSITWSVSGFLPPRSPGMIFVSNGRQIDTPEAMFRGAGNTALEVFLSLLADEQGGTSSPISQVT